jgi:hypothetical protein
VGSSNSVHFCIAGYKYVLEVLYILLVIHPISIVALSYFHYRHLTHDLCELFDNCVHRSVELVVIKTP